MIILPYGSERRVIRGPGLLGSIQISYHSVLVNQIEYDFLTPAADPPLQAHDMTFEQPLNTSLRIQAAEAIP